MELQRSDGIIVDLNIFPDYADTRSPQQLAAELAAQVAHPGKRARARTHTHTHTHTQTVIMTVGELAAQVADPRSLLRNAPSTRRVLKADVHVGHVSPPPNAATVQTSANGSPASHLSPPTASQRAPAPPMQDGGSGVEYKGVGLVLREDEVHQHVVRRLVPNQVAPLGRCVCSWSPGSTLSLPPSLSVSLRFSLCLSSLSLSSLSVFPLFLSPFFPLSLSLSNSLSPSLPPSLPDHGG